MKTLSFIKTLWILSLAMIVCGCKRDMSASFEVIEVRVLSRDEVSSVMGNDWERRLSGVPMPPAVVFVGLASNSDLAEYIQKRSSGVSVAVHVCGPERRQLKIVAPMVYSGGKNVTERAIAHESSAVTKGTYQYQIALWTDGPVDQPSELLERGASICVQLKAANMATIYLSKEIVITKTMLSRGPSGSGKTSAGIEGQPDGVRPIKVDL